MRLIHGMFVIVVAVVATTSRAQNAKFQGKQFDLDRAATSDEVDPRSNNIQRPDHPELKVRVLIAGGRAVPDRLKGFLTLPADNVGPMTRAFMLRQPGRDAIAAALNAPEVLRLELVRPLHLEPPVDRVPFNRDARLSHNVHLFEANIHSGQGATISAAVIDGGSIRKSHVEFATDRVSLGEPDVAEDEHATHVAGTMAARGAREDARGMSPQLKLISHSFNGDDLQKLQGVAPRVQISNHSYGPRTGWDRIRGRDGTYRWYWFGDVSVSGQEDGGFGQYTTECHLIDTLLTNNPHLLAVVAAGNDRDDGPASQPVSHFIYQIDPTTGQPNWVISSATRNRDGFKSGGLDTIAGLGVSKNALCVGAVNDLFQQGAPIPNATIGSTFFSSWGPTDDHRVKPDVVANGQTLISCTTPPPGGSSTPDELYDEMSGTSMASPTASGIAAVLAEYFEKKKGRKPDSPELKGLLIHTATDAGVVGPDPVFGHGSIDALRAGELIKAHNGEILRSDEVAAGQTKTYDLKPSTAPVRVTVAWLDPAAPAALGGINDSAATLQNNLDLTLSAPGGKVYFPYRLSHTNPMAQALADGPNRVDNVEVVDAPASSTSGLWKVAVKASELKSGAKQRFALIVSGLKE